MRRGEIWWANLDVPRGSEPGFRRPVVIIQADAFNQSRISTTLAIPLTSTLALARAPGNVIVRKHPSGIHHDSVANTSQIIALDRNLLDEPIGRVSSSIMRQIEHGLHLVLDLD